jgi:hypothetical protein
MPRVAHVYITGMYVRNESNNKRGETCKKKSFAMVYTAIRNAVEMKKKRSLCKMVSSLL